MQAKGAFLQTPRRLPIKTKGNCKGIEKHLMMKITSYDEYKWAKLRLYPTGFPVIEQPLVHYIYTYYTIKYIYQSFKFSRMSFTKKLLVSTVEISQMGRFKDGFLIELLHFSIKGDCLLFCQWRTNINLWRKPIASTETNIDVLWLWSRIRWNIPLLKNVGSWTVTSAAWSIVENINTKIEIANVIHWVS